jgi:hypothetical protein
MFHSLIASMTLEQALCYRLSPPILIIATVLLPMALSIVGLLLFRKIVPFRFLRESHDVTGPFFCTLGTVYGIFMAFIVSAIWQQYCNTSNNLVQEARYLNDLYFVTKAFPQPTQDELQNLLRNYRDSLVNDEWLTMAAGEASPKSDALIRQIGKLYLNYKNSPAMDHEFFHVSVQYLTQMTSLRAARIDDSSSSLPILLWIVLLLGGAATVGLSYLFEAKNIWLQGTMTGLLTGVICMTFYCIINLDFPFTGPMALSPEPIQNIQMN